VAWKEPRYVLSWPGYLPELANHKIDRRRVTRAVTQEIDLDVADDRDQRRDG
jgi:hypothetical protein